MGDSKELQRPIELRIDMLRGTELRANELRANELRAKPTSPELPAEDARVTLAF
jgi:hypothetical protein